MSKEINPFEVYTTKEVQDILKISESTIKRLIKNGVLGANKVGKQYRILGKEILRLISPEVEKKATEKYLNIKNKAVDKIRNW